MMLSLDHQSFLNVAIGHASKFFVANNGRMVTACKQLEALHGKSTTLYIRDGWSKFYSSGKPASVRSISCDVAFADINGQVGYMLYISSVSDENVEPASRGQHQPKQAAVKTCRDILKEALERVGIDFAAAISDEGLIDICAKAADWGAVGRAQAQEGSGAAMNEKQLAWLNRTLAK